MVVSGGIDRSIRRATRACPPPSGRRRSRSRFAWRRHPGGARDNGLPPGRPAHRPGRVDGRVARQGVGKWLVWRAKASSPAKCAGSSTCEHVAAPARRRVGAAVTAGPWERASIIRPSAKPQPVFEGRRRQQRVRAARCVPAPPGSRVGLAFGVDQPGVLEPPSLGLHLARHGRGGDRRAGVDQHRMVCAGYPIAKGLGDGRGSGVRRRATRFRPGRSWR